MCSHCIIGQGVTLLDLFKIAYAYFDEHLNIPAFSKMRKISFSFRVTSVEIRQRYSQRLLRLRNNTFLLE